MVQGDVASEWDFSSFVEGGLEDPDNPLDLSVLADDPNEQTVHAVHMLDNPGFELVRYSSRGRKLIPRKRYDNSIP